MSTNTICSLTTLQFESPGGPVGVIMLNLKIADTARADGFVQEFVEKFKLQRLSSPLRTESLLITLAGELTVDGFARRWRELAAGDAVLALIMSRMSRADVSQTDAAGETCATSSLLPDATQVASQPKVTASQRATPGSGIRPNAREHSGLVRMLAGPVGA